MPAGARRGRVRAVHACLCVGAAALAAAGPFPAAGSPGRAAVTNVVHADGSAEVRLFGYSAEGSAVEGLRVTSGGANAGGIPVSPALAAAAALVTPAFTQRPVTLELKGGTRLWRPSMYFPALGAPPPGLSLVFSATTGDASVATAEWDAARGGFNLSDASWAGEACGGGSGYAATTTLDVSVWAAGLGDTAVARVDGVNLTVSCDPQRQWPDWSVIYTTFTGYSTTTAATVDGRMFVAGYHALYSGSHNYLHEYFPDTGGALELPNPPIPRSSNELVALGPGDLLYIGGQADNAQRRIVHRWNDGIGWRGVASMIDARCCGFAAAKIGDYVYVAGGYSAISYTKKAEVLDLATMTWSSLPEMPEKLYGTSGAVFQGKLHVVGGNGKSGRSGSHHVFDPAANNGAGSWTTLSGLGSNRKRMHGKLVNAGSVLYYLGGESSFADRYDPATDTWSPTQDLPRTSHESGVVFYNGQIVVVGGAGYGSATTASIVGDVVPS